MPGVDMLDILQSCGSPVDLAAGGIVDAVITLYEVLQGRPVVFGKGEILAHLIVIAFGRIDLFKFLLVLKTMI